MIFSATAVGFGGTYSVACAQHELHDSSTGRELLLQPRKIGLALRDRHLVAFPAIIVKAQVFKAGKNVLCADLVPETVVAVTPRLVRGSFTNEVLGYVGAVSHGN